MRAIRRALRIQRRIVISELSHSRRREHLGRPRQLNLGSISKPRPVLILAALTSTPSTTPPGYRWWRQMR